MLGGYRNTTTMVLTGLDIKEKAAHAELLTEAAHLGVERYELPNLRALNFVVAGLLAPGVAATARPDAQAKGLGE